ncbi:MAG: n-acetylglutamate synthase [Fibrobacterota bacterium]|nr:n-acetylglutamate synthase [Fibrobacterota bacterium]
MKAQSLNGKTFRTFSNSDNGEVGSETLFLYHEDGGIIWAEYSGGLIRKGFLIGKRITEDTLDLCYQHISLDGGIRTGICASTITMETSGKIRILEKWRWTCGDGSEGESVILETDQLEATRATTPGS